MVIEILQALRDCKDYISGEALSDTLKVSRAAIHQSINNLRKEGYEIEAKQNRGYKLISSPDFIDKKELSAFLSKERMENIETHDELTSTNTYLNALAHQGNTQVQVVLADFQSQGKGRLGRSFLTLPGKGVYLSYLFKPQTKPQDTAMVTAWVAVAVYRVLKRLYQIDLEIKWVNDLIFQGKKIGGILTEMAVESESGLIQHIIIGVGLNIGQEEQDFPDDLKEKAGSLFMETGKRIKRAEIAAALITELDLLAEDWPQENEQYLKIYKEHCLNIGQELYVFRNEQTISAQALDWDEQFGLIVQYPNGVKETLRSGEVQVRGKSGYIL
ncbi:MAG: biotin--[acetyl-CoA-carboxylase] ligase [Firmicutes bacterium]|nr:biotin--[acetyl-CoA-carboxylase] ligase [Bacillota bacterium]